ncbi:MAG TPA: type I-C CRISPR-associated protein Cas8c/Csd1 [Nitrosomonas sp.]|nr:type I-C CRISPR-associated protein Cas8c/Csd1 [Nitrosomonas sp.]HQX13608.1 type I-C CRISPR-associated protein Cas8c/Csd1 [Nitrosomonas sp.]HRB32995.1 type I-C CRISPR-associated protein Cas8c/Csd1 [Nitrosomonas sp.]HRB45656.1 type I-C CRISPR-associated protein Cas8c/Csd1 [Nitrosomonas sp.]HRB77661.1 type I-C CRISPR-associated protein Cas8c/Csd1 [Nitrosomonas sp.]
MILQALNEYYQRKTQLPDSNLAPPGFEHKPIPFLIVLTADGNFVSLDDTREGEGKKKIAKTYLVPQTVKRSSGVAANLLWDHSGYVLGVDGKGKPERVREQHSTFLDAIRARFAASDDAGIRAVLSFLEHGNFETVFLHSLWPEILETGANLTFRLEGDSEPVCERAAVVAALSIKDDSDSEKTSLCLVSGKEDVIERLHPSVKGVWGAQSSGASVVSFNLDAFSSYGKSQGGNAPVGKQAVFSYTTALNHLLAKDSKQRIQVGDASTVFWAATPGHPMEELFPGFFSEPSKDNPDLGTAAVAALLSAPKTGAGSFEDDGTPFYVLGLAPNAARIAVRFWHVKTVSELAVNIRRHFDDLRIVHAPHEPETLSLFRLLVATAMLGKSENIPPNLGGDVMRSVLEGLSYPQTLLSGANRRIRAEHEVTYPRAAIIKACINRQSGKEELKVSLDENNANTAYRLGRLFAVLERIQERANPNINATIRDRYYGAASGTPVTVFSTLLKLKNHHLAKLENKGEVINYEKLLGQIMDGITDFPAQLGLQDQSRFAIGYYHQRQAFFIKSESIANKGE